MPRKVIIDCDPGIDDAIALCMALFEPRLEVVAVTAVEGNVPAERASLNVQTVIDQLDPPRYPRVGAATAVEAAPHVDTAFMQGEDGLGNASFAVSQLHHQHPSEKIICDEVRAAPEQVTIICFGPLTNLVRAFQRDPELPLLIDQVIMSGGSINGIGNITPAAEFNMFFDPVSARTVFRSPMTKTLIPLDVTEKVQLTLGFVDQLPSESTRAGCLVRRLTSFAFRAFRQHLGQESIYIHDVVTLTAALHPELFETQEMAGDVETAGELTKGATIFDRRANIRWRSNMAVATDVDVAAATDCILRGLAEAGRCT
ncbi:MAG: nucleoside hydrolase [Planctomycetes bacterium]|nr:nucleoside hydrolase [Planctomycetota bacterium]